MTSSASPKDPPTPAPIPASRLDDDADAGAGVVAAGLEVAVAVVVTEAVFVLVDNVQADVRLNITGPSSIENGDLLPFVLLIQVLFDESAWPQQNRLLLLYVYRGYIHCPLVRPTVKRVSA